MFRSEDSLSQNPHHIAACVIGRSWRRWRFRSIFRALKAALFKAERSVTLDVLKKLCPREAEFVSDPMTQPRIRFRFGGDSFPPNIYFKVYTKSLNVHYFSGSRIIESGSQAARDACRVMGPRAFTDLVLSKAAYVRTRQIAEPVDVTNRLEYVRYMNEVDHLAPQHGGRNNGWRELSFSSISSQATVFDTNALVHSNVARRRTGAPRLKPKMRAAHGVGGAIVASAGGADQDGGGDARMQHLVQVELEDDFVNLFEWTTNLHVGDLEDYIAI
ncbi:hypothetical protein BC830DRAFT_1103872 [Chytriomyces sp. MP71]|nr:hypothetical protein BC830DRAFT_1103872 [Chytriomyces sp. MP71]